MRRKLLESQQMVDIMKDSNRELNAKVVSLSKLASFFRCSLSLSLSLPPALPPLAIPEPRS